MVSPIDRERIFDLAADPAPWALAAVIVALPVWWLAGAPVLALAAVLLCITGWGCGRSLGAMRRVRDGAVARCVTIEDALRQSQKMEAVGRLTAGIAHDFNNHLTAISGNVELLKRHLEPGQEKLVDHADAALQGVQRAAVLTGRLLSLSRQPTPEAEAVDIGRLLGGLSELLRRTLGEGIDLAVRVPDDQSFVWADVNQMESVLLSLAVNVRGQIAHGGVLTLTADAVRLDALFASTYPGVLSGDYIRIVVGDAAMVAAEAVPDAGGPRQPADDPANAELSMARGFARQAGGCLLGSAGGSALLRMFLPRYQPPALSAAAAHHRGDGPMTVLVVEDDVEIRALCMQTLRALDFDVLEASDAMAAIRLVADRGGIDLLFTDLGLPGGVSGRALADAARTVDPGIRVLFSSAFVQSAERGDTAFLPKPFDAVQLGDMVTRVLRAPVAGGCAETVQG